MMSQLLPLEKRIDSRYNSVKGYLDTFCFNTVNEVFFRKLTKDGADEHTYSEFFTDCCRMAQTLINRGFTDKCIALLAENRYEHFVCMFGSFMAGAKYVPLNIAADGQTTALTVNFSEAEAVFVSQTFIPLIQAVLPSCPGIKQVMYLDGGSENGEWDYSTMVSEGADYDETGFYGDFDDTRVAMRVFTSGTTGGKPKCVELTNKNLFTTARYMMYDQLDILPDEHDSVFYSPLPTFHLASFCIVVSYAIPLGGTYATSNTPKDSFRDISVLKPVFLHTVPAIAGVLLSFIEGAIEKMGDKEWFEGFCKECDEGKYTFRQRRELCRKYLAPVGGQLAAMTIAGAQADAEMVRKFECLGISASCDYGMTESAPLISFDLQLYKHRGAVGRIMPYLESKIEDNVLYVKGDSVMKGYFNNPEATADTLVDGWLSTGDLVYMDEEGFLYIKGRANSVVVLSNGDNVDIDELTVRFTAADAISEIVIIADKKNNRDTLGALVYPSEGASYEDVEKAIFAINEGLTVQQRIGRFRLVDKPFEKNSMLKIKRFLYLEEEI